jgi:hypothetical protein
MLLSDQKTLSCKAHPVLLDREHIPFLAYPNARAVHSRVAQSETPTGFILTRSASDDPEAITSLVFSVVMARVLLEREPL